MRRLVRILWRPAISFWASAGLLLAYPLSVGPASWLLWNIRLPDAAVTTLEIFYCPLVSGLSQSSSVQAIMFYYERLWADFSRQSASRLTHIPKAPPLFPEAMGAVVGAWMIWQFVRWLNQRKTPRLATPQVAP